MTYPDPKSVRNYRHSVNLNFYEQQLVDAAAQYLGIEPAALIRELAIRQALIDLQQPIENQAKDKDANKLL